VITDSLVRAVAAAVALFLAGRLGGRSAPVFAGAAAALAALGPTRTAFPGPFEAVFVSAGAALLFAVGARREFPAITGEAARITALAAGGAAAAALVSGRRLDVAGAAALAALLVLALSAFGAETCRAGGEAGWREGLARTLGVALPAALGSGFAAAVVAAGRSALPWLILAALAVAVLVWAPALLAERARVEDELAEEVTLGLLPDEDAKALRLPWTRGFEKRFGRPDERREYVRSALLLAVARHQQRHRSGEAVRLRQLEVLTFRTRLRRTQEARAARFARSESAEFLRIPGD
jgi:hypothetical protein